MTVTKIAIMGTGPMASALGYSWTHAGHVVRIGSRVPGDPRMALLRPFASIGTHEDAAREADVIVLALPFPEIVRFASLHRKLLAGKTIIDPSNSFDYLIDGTQGSSELVAEGLGSGVGLVGAFKDNSAAKLVSTSSVPVEVQDIRLVADDPVAIAIVAGLVRDMGHNPVDCGPLHNSRLLDASACLLLEAGRRADHSRTSPGRH